MRVGILAMPARQQDSAIAPTPANCSSLADVDDEHQATCTLGLDIAVRGMVRNMAMDQPLAWPSRKPDDSICVHLEAPIRPIFQRHATFDFDYYIDGPCRLDFR